QRFKVVGLHRSDHYEAVFGTSGSKSFRLLGLGKLRFLKFVGWHPQQRIKHRKVDIVTPPGLLAREQRGLNRTERVRPAANIANHDSGGQRAFHSLLIRKINQIEAARRVEHWSVGATFGPRTGLTKA